MQSVLANGAVSVSALKKNPSAVVSGAKGAPVAVLNHNKVMAYMVSAETFEALLENLDDQALAEIVRSRAHEKGMKVSLDDL
ncbi:type II toxin-antitoxin system Phd/YefM family antitoxin [Metapseudomonas lalkuanensis]|uniref:type II toxin-antitoxin system Phd/YefM family antitoxin n=1 Tax=Metapseudomonas lalkuanensis TaxID=2604832 RepID=UPI001CF0E105|nr:type II toxin-antitoxin system Phd/YefM family antitoxin [Pseudomonas lalkuanensis]UCO97677.1 type II toxin-antitoxin system Phd/YefM family antitoxin [Pseudomonas lalkuanensis]